MEEFIVKRQPLFRKEEVINPESSEPLMVEGGIVSDLVMREQKGLDKEVCNKVWEARYNLTRRPSDPITEPMEEPIGIPYGKDVSDLVKVNGARRYLEIHRKFTPKMRKLLTDMIIDLDDVNGLLREELVEMPDDFLLHMASTNAVIAEARKTKGLVD